MASITDSLTTSYDYVSYASVASDQDLVAAGGGQCRWIYCGGAGDLVVTKPDGTDDTIVAVDGYVHMGAASVIKAATTATNITVYF